VVTHAVSQGPLLNFWIAPIKMCDPLGPGHDYVYPSVEHRFQAMKALYLTEEIDWNEAHNRIADADTAKEAKEYGRALPIAVSLWDRASFGVMLEAHIAKFFQHKDLREHLMRTSGEMIVERRPDPIWGDGRDGKGLNLCGKSLTIVRDMVRNYF
jgi:ribA/ribD-fused uncharacterized protein